MKRGFWAGRIDETSMEEEGIWYDRRTELDAKVSGLASWEEDGTIS